MYKKMAGFAAFVFAVSLFFPLSSGAEGDLSNFVKGKNTVNVFLKEFVNESGQSQINPDDFKKKFEAALLRRKAVKLVVVSSPDASDMQISCVIKKYLYSKTDPINSYGNSITMAIDAVTNQNYAELTGEFAVIDTKSANIVWKNGVMAYVEKMMTPEESIPLVYDKLARAFLWKAFGKPNKKMKTSGLNL
ncbi:MAG: hypothetical protein Q8N91_00850 [Candidatus Omnitrophota bacterium]|nr:hypothetical protein [Candidatus Omnitrophota bacterium]